MTVTIYAPPHSSHTLLKAVILKIHGLFLSNLSPTLSEWRLFCVSIRRSWVLNIQRHVWLGNKPASNDILCVFQLYVLHKKTLTLSNIAVNVCVMAVFYLGFRDPLRDFILAVMEEISHAPDVINFPGFFRLACCLRAPGLVVFFCYPMTRCHVKRNIKHSY